MFLKMLKLILLLIIRLKMRILIMEVERKELREDMRKMRMMKKDQDNKDTGFNAHISKNIYDRLF